MNSKPIKLQDIKEKKIFLTSNRCNYCKTIENKVKDKKDIEKVEYFSEKGKKYHKITDYVPTLILEDNQNNIIQKCDFTKTGEVICDPESNQKNDKCNFLGTQDKDEKC